MEFCIEADDLKQAVSAGRRFGLLQDAFPTLERAYRQRTLGRLAGKRQWAVAATLAGEDAQLQVRTFPMQQMRPCRDCISCGAASWWRVRLALGPVTSVMPAHRVRAAALNPEPYSDACTLCPSSSPKP